MSFQEQYQKEIDQIRVDGSVKGTVRAALRAEPEAPRKRRVSLPLRALAFSLCAALLITGSLLLTRRKPIAHIMTESIPTRVIASYGDLYNAVKGLSGYYGNFVRDYYEDEAVYAEADSFTNAKSAASATGTNAAADDSAAATADYSETTKQVEGVEEADIVKTDGKYIYRLARNASDYGYSLVIVDTGGDAPKVVCNLALDKQEASSGQQKENSKIMPYVYSSSFSTMYVSGDRLILLGYDYTATEARTLAAFYDITDRANPTLVQEVFQCGGMNDSRMIGDTLYLISEHFIGGVAIDEENPITFAPYVKCGTEETAVPAESVYVYDNCQQPVYTVVCSYSAKTGEMQDTKSILGGSYAVYCNTENLLTAGYEKDGKTQLVRFALEGKTITAKANGEVAGTLLNQFSMDEHKGYFRFVTTDMNETTWQPFNVLTVLDSDLKPVGKIDDIAPGERVYSVRFMGDTGYFVTFRQVDPLFSVDLSDPKKPKIIGSLKIPGFSDYLFPYGEGKLLGIGKNADEKTGVTGSVKLSLFDISDPANVTEQFKTDVDAFDAEALYNHKACLADAGKNLIGFSASYEDFSYRLYTLETDGFKLLADVPLEEKDSCRGLYIGNTFYIAENGTLLYFDLDRPDKIQKLSLS